ncbi:hypothetical protein V8E36_000858 [Tilletia maclaganii]
MLVVREMCESAILVRRQSSTPSAWSMVQRGERRLLAARKTRMNSTLCPDRLTLEPLASKGNETIDMFLNVSLDRLTSHQASTHQHGASLARSIVSEREKRPAAAARPAKNATSFGSMRSCKSKAGGISSTSKLVSVGASPRRTSVGPCREHERSEESVELPINRNLCTVQDTASTLENCSIHAHHATGSLTLINWSGTDGGTGTMGPWLRRRLGKTD